MTANAAPAEQFCVNHPWRATVLRCNRCGRAVCNRCIKHTPVGYRCKQCLQNLEQSLANARLRDYVLAVFIPAAVSGLSSLISLFSPFCGLFLLTSPVIGVVLAALMARLLRGRRGPYLRWAVLGGALAGGLGMGVFIELFSFVTTLVGYHTDTGAYFILAALLLLHTGLCLLGLWFWLRQLAKRGTLTF